MRKHYYCENLLEFPSPVAFSRKLLRFHGFNHLSGAQFLAEFELIVTVIQQFLLHSNTVNSFVSLGDYSFL